MALALAGAGAAVYAISSAHVEDAALSQVEQELAEFRAFVEPSSITRPADVPGPLREKLRTFIGRNIPYDSEVLVGWLEGRPRDVLAGADVEDAEGLLRDPQVRVVVRQVAAEGTTTTVDTSVFGELVVAAQPVEQGPSRGALVVVTSLDLERADLFQTMRTYTLVASLSLVIITAVAAWQSGRLLAPLRLLRETTDDITETDLARRLPEVGNDDITSLARTLNGMLERLESAFAGQRRFLDDAGHELRTPLTVLRGHLELLDHGDPADVAQTRALLVEEVDRMSRLVGDLILLAKSDRPDFIDPATVEVSGLTRTVLSKARGLAERHWQLDETATGEVTMDVQRVTQAVLQLAENAVKHTHDGDTIAIGSRLDAGVLRLWVRDSGPGVSDADRERIFERFARSEVDPGDEGFGLGLSIVRAIARAHHGEVHLADQDPDRPGARFVITLPARTEQRWPGS